MSCEKYQDLIKKRLDGIISEEEFSDLKAHAQECWLCREELGRCTQIQDIVKQALSSRTSPQRASQTILSQITPRRIRPAPILLFGKRTAIAASILLAIGLLLGFGLARVTTAGRIAAIAAQVPIKVTQLEGTVLVKHQNSDLWQRLQPGSKIHLGDTFHSTAKSGVVLELEDKSTIELNHNGMLVLKLYNGGTQFHLEYGKLAATLNSPHPPFVVSTPHGQVEALGTEFTVTVE
jgi:hypothetical protein